MSHWCRQGSQVFSPLVRRTPQPWQAQVACCNNNVTFGWPELIRDL